MSQRENMSSSVVAAVAVLGGCSQCVQLEEEAEGQREQDWNQDTAERQRRKQTGQNLCLELLCPMTTGGQDTWETLGLTPETPGG